MNLSYSDFISNHPDDEKATTDVENDRFTDDEHVKTLLGNFPIVYYKLNYRTKEFEFIHNCHILGYSDSEFKTAGLQKSLKNIHPDDYKLISGTIFPIIWDFITTVPDDQHNYRFSINYRYMRKDKSYMHLQQHLTFIDFDNNKLPDRNLSIIYDISPFKTDNSILLTITRISEDKEDIISQKKYFH